MRLLVRHETTYSYATPAASIIQHLRMTPRPHEGLFVRKWRVEIDADYRLDRGEDAFGNVLHTFTADGPVTELRVVVSGDVETTDNAGVLKRANERFPLMFWMRPTRLTAACAKVQAWTNDVAAGEGGDLLSTVHALNRSLHETMEIAPGNTDTGTTASEAFEKKGGVSQDFAHVLIAAARHRGIPARCVSGYRLATGPGPQSRHAWVEAYVQGIGWIAFDPTIGASPTDDYVRVAVGLDHLDAAPVRGAHTGGTNEILTVLVDVAQGPSIIED